MITLKIPYTTSETNTKVISDLRQQFSSVVRYAYNRASEGVSQKDIRVKVKTLNNVSDLGCWFTQCAILEGIGIKKKNKDKKVIFGGAKNFMLRIKNKLSREQLTEK